MQGLGSALEQPWVENRMERYSRCNGKMGGEGGLTKVYAHVYTCIQLCVLHGFGFGKILVVVSR